MRLEQHPVTLLYLETLEINCIPFRVITLGPFLSTQQDVGAHLSQITTEVAVCFSVSLCVVAAESYEMLIKNKKLIMFLIDMILFIVCSSFENQLLKVLTVKIQCRDFFFCTSFCRCQELNVDRRWMLSRAYLPSTCPRPCTRLYNHWWPPRCWHVFSHGSICSASVLHTEQPSQLLNTKAAASASFRESCIKIK